MPAADTRPVNSAKPSNAASLKTLGSQKGEQSRARDGSDGNHIARLCVAIDSVEDT